MNFFNRVVEVTRSRFFRSESKQDSGSSNETFPNRERLTIATSSDDLVTPSPIARPLVPPSAPRRTNRPTRPLRVVHVPQPSSSRDEEPLTVGSRIQLQVFQIARSLMDLTRGFPNSHSSHRNKVVQNKTKISRLSVANPQYHPNSFADERIRPQKLDVLMSQPVATPEVVRQHAWNPHDRSLNIYVKEDQLTLHRYPVPKSTDGIRGKVGFSCGFHVWEINWPEKQRGTHPVLGVSTKVSVLHSVGYGSLLGINAESYGWDINSLRCYHDSKNSKGWSYPAEQPAGFSVPSVIYCILDMDEGYLAFATPKQYLGIAFRGLAGKTLYPTVSAVWGQCEIKMRYIGGLPPTPRLLVDICRKKVRTELGESRLNRIGELELPRELERYTIGR